MTLAATNVSAGVDITSILGIGGPIAGIAAILGYLLNAYLAKRRDDREDKKLGVETESGIVETTGKALEIVRAQMDRMEQDQLKLRSENDELNKTVRSQSSKMYEQEQNVNRLESRINWLEIDNNELREEIAVLRGESPNAV